MDFFIGPCVIESKQFVLDVAGVLKEIFVDIEGACLTFKSSFDKANRTSIDSFRALDLKKA